LVSTTTLTRYEEDTETTYKSIFNQKYFSI